MTKDEIQKKVMEIGDKLNKEKVKKKPDYKEVKTLQFEIDTLLEEYIKYK